MLIEFIEFPIIAGGFKKGCPCKTKHLNVQPCEDTRIQHEERDEPRNSLRTSPKRVTDVHAGVPSQSANSGTSQNSNVAEVVKPPFCSKKSGQLNEKEGQYSKSIDVDSSQESFIPPGQGESCAHFK